MSRIKIEINEHDLKRLVKEYSSNKLGAPLNIDDIKIETKSKQNYKSE